MKYCEKVMDQQSNMDCKTVSMNEDVIMQSKYFQYCPVKKSKRYRSAFTTEQINYLESEFKKFPYIGSANRKELANILKMSERAIKIWFQNRRMKEKREVGNKESVTDYKKNTKNEFPYKQINIVSIPSNSNEKMFINQVKINRKEYFKESQSEPKNTPISHKIMNLENKRNDKTIVTQKNVLVNPSRNKSILQQKIRNISKISQHPSFNPIKTYFHSPKEKQYSKTNKTIHDLSLGKNGKLQQAIYPVQISPDQRMVPHYTPPLQSYFAPPVPTTMHPGNVIWKPVSLMPVVPGLSQSVIGHNNGGFSLNNHEITKETCNYHGPSHVYNAQAQCGSRLPPQYILAIPFSSSVQK